MNDQAADLKIRTVVPWALLFLLLSSLPYLVAWLLPPPGKQFVGTFVNPDDLSTYLAAIRQGGEGEWLYHFPFSPEPWQPKLMLVPYVLTGKAAALVGGGGLFWFHALRVTAVCFTLGMGVWWVRTLFPGQQRLQFTGWLFLVFGAGAGWLLAILGFSQSLSTYLLDLGGPEWSVFMALFHTPHFALGLGLELYLFICVLHLGDGAGAGRWALAGAGAGVMLGLTYVYHIPVAGLVIGLYLLALSWQQRRIPWRLWGYGLLILLPLTAMLIYYAVIANQDPYFADYARFQHVIPPPPLPAVLVGAGFLGLWALAGLRRWFQDGRTWLVPLWLAGNLLLLYLPLIQFSGRFALGLMVPVATMAAWGVEKVVLPRLAQRPFYHRFSRLTPTPYASLRRVFLFLAVPSTIIMPFLLARTAVETEDFPTYLPTAEAEAARWLAGHSQAGDLVLAHYPMGNFLPRYLPGKVFVGQLDYTTDLEGKLALVDQFWQPDTPAAWRRQFLQTWGINYVYVGRYEQALMETAVTPPGERIYEAGGVSIYHIPP